MLKRRHDLILNTTTSCFLCYEETGSANNDIDIEKDKPFLYSLKSMCRYLKVDLSKTIASRESLLPILPKVNVQVSLCQGCGIVLKQFAKFYQDLEAIKIKLGICLEGVSKKIQETSKKPELLGEHLKRVKTDSNPKARLHARMVGRLRKEVMLKSLSCGKPQPRIKLRTIPDPGARFECNLCHKTFAGKMDAKFHMRKVHDVHLFPCKYCDVEFFSAGALYNHHRSGCNSQHRKQSVKGTFNSGINRPAPGAVRVETVDLGEGNDGAAISQIQTLKPLNPPPGPGKTLATSDSPYITQVRSLKSSAECNIPIPPQTAKIVPDMSKVPQMIAVPSTEAKIVPIEPHGNLCHQCPCCSKSFPELPAWKVHMTSGRCQGLTTSQPQLTSNDPEKPHQCKLCPFSFSTNYGLGNHVTRMHPATKVYRKHVCDVCQKLFNTMRQLKAHRRESHDKEWLTCKYCGKKVFSSTRLDNHYRSHQAQSRRLQKEQDSNQPGAAATLEKQGQPETLATVDAQEYNIGAVRNDSNDDQNVNLNEIDSESEPILLGFDYGLDHEVKPGLGDEVSGVSCQEQDADPLAQIIFNK